MEHALYTGPLVPPMMKTRRSETVRANQRTAAEEVVEVFHRSRENYVLLMAQPQVGKTGTFNEVIRLAFEKGLIDRAFIICGSTETLLRNQAMRDAAVYNSDLMEDGRLRVIFHTAFDKSSLLGPDGTLKRTLIVIDESHLDQDMNQKLDVFLCRHKLTLNGTTPFMEENNIYILSVSATPFSEISDITHRSSNKELIYLKPDAGYRGIRYFIENRLIEAAYFNIHTNPVHFMGMVLAKGSRYNLVRVSSTDARDEFAIRNYAKILGIDVKCYEQGLKQIEIEDLATAPARPTIVILKNMLRCGKVVPKGHIGLCWESTKVGATDTIVQSLLGRMCGYYDTSISADDMPTIYVPPNLLEKKKRRTNTVDLPDIAEHLMDELELYLAMVEDKYEVMPTLGRNLKPFYEHKDRGVAPCYPLMFGPGELYDDFEGEDGEANIMARVKTTILGAHYIAAITAKVDATVELSRAQRIEIKEILNSLALQERPQIGFRYLGTTTNARVRDQIYNTISTGELTIEVFQHGDTPFRMAVAYDKEADDNGVAGNLFVTFQLKTHGETLLKYRKPPTTGLELFSREDLPVMDNSVCGVGTMVGITRSAREDPEKLGMALHQLLKLQRSSTALTVSSFLTSFDGGNCFSFNKAAYGWNGTSCAALDAIFRRLKTEFGVTMTYKVNADTRRRTSLTDYMYVERIIWA